MPSSNCIRELQVTPMPEVIEAPGFGFLPGHTDAGPGSKTRMAPLRTLLRHLLDRSGLALPRQRPAG